MHAAAVAISRALARASAHLENAGDGLELGEIQGLQLCIMSNLTRAWPRASSAAGQARRNARDCGRDQPGAGRGHVRTTRVPPTSLSLESCNVGSASLP